MTSDATWITIFNPIQKFNGNDYRPYALAIGQASIAWNYLHEELSALFVYMAQGGQFEGDAVWYSSNFDRPRRQMLKAAIESAGARRKANLSDEIKSAYAEILWVLSEAEKLEDLRNTVLRAPIYNFPDGSANFGLPEGVSADTSKGNPRAKRLRNTALGLRQIRWFRDAATILGNYSHCLQWELTHGGLPSLERPKLPNRGQKNTPQRPRRRPRQE